ncbi:MAG: FeoA domain-containing protein [Chitinophagales bacterium]|nr:FeoA domain-containing protein [Chitinophagales bacterium]
MLPLNSLTLKPGKTGIIHSLKESHISPKLLEMGFLPGKEIRLLRTAPGGSPLYLDLQGHFIALRKDEAEVIVLKSGN